MKKANNVKTLVLIALVAVLPHAAISQEYVIGGGDLLKITVYDHPDLTTEARVSNEGKITFPLIGEVQVDNSTANDVEKKIGGLLADGYIIKPQVSVFIEEYKSRKVTMLGEVAKPGIVILRAASTLLEVISDAGGITPNAGEALTIQRKINKTGVEKKEKEDMTVSVDLKKLFEEGDVTANIMVLDGDSIYVPRAAFVYVNGEVRNPGAYKITKGLTVLKSITIAGGYTPKSGQSRTKIIRKTPQGEVTTRAKMDELVMPDDIVFVPESLF